MSDREIPKYSMTIQWSPEDDAFIVTIPELPGCKTHGASYEEAAKHGHEIIELVVGGLHGDTEAIPAPQFYRFEHPVSPQPSREQNLVRRAS